MKASFGPYLRTVLDLLAWRVPLAVALTVGVSLVEGVGLLLLVPLLGLVGLEVEQGETDRLARLTSSAFDLVGIEPTLVAVLGAFALVATSQALLRRWQETTTQNMEQELVAALRQRLYRAIVRTRWLYFSCQRSSDFAHVLTAEVDRAGEATQHLLLLLSEAIVILVYLALALQLSPPLTLLVLGVGGGLALLMRPRVEGVRRSGQEISAAVGDLYAATLEHLGAMKTAKSYNAEQRHAALFSRLTDRIAGVFITTIRAHADVTFWLDTAAVLVLCAILYVSLELLGVSASGVLLLLFLFYRLIPKLAGIQQSAQHFASTLPAFDTVARMQARCAAEAESDAESGEAAALRRDIRLAGISFAYDDGLPLVIRDLDLLIPVGSTTAIVGPSGAGKSTVADLVLGLIAPTGGRVLVDGTALTAERARAWRARIGYVPQDTFLFHDTIRANLLWARPDASEADLLEALRLAAAEAFVRGLPAGLDTVAGDRGVRLSGGERQRLALARALLREPTLLILDEATSSLDSENERRILGAIEHLHGRITILLITHRISAIRDADVIHVLEDGRLVESGPWAALVSDERGRFRAMCRAQGIDL